MNFLSHSRDRVVQANSLRGVFAHFILCKGQKFPPTFIDTSSPTRVLKIVFKRAESSVSRSAKSSEVFADFLERAK
jgi:hypothetical protein